MATTPTGQNPWEQYYFDPAQYAEILKTIQNTNGNSSTSGGGALGGFGGFAMNQAIPGAGGIINAFSGGGIGSLFDPTGGMLFGSGETTIRDILKSNTGSINKMGNYYGVPVYDPESGRIISRRVTETEGGLFGGGGTSSEWQPYIQGGQYYFQDPSRRNPVGIATTPGASLKPSKTYRKMANQVQAFVDLFPAYSQALAGQIIPQQQAQLAAAQATSDPYAQLMLDLYQKFGPQLNEVGNQILEQNAMATAEREGNVLAGPGGELVRKAMELQRQQDPEFFATRELTSNRLKELMEGIDLSGVLSESERREIEQGLAREGASRGTLNAPSASDTVGNAMRYGQANTNRKTLAQNQLSQAIAQANTFLPQSRSGVDVFQVATGRSSMTNPGAGQFTGVNNTGAQTLDTLAGFGQNITGNINNLQMNDDNIRLQRDLNEKDWLDKFVQFTQGLSNVTSSLGSVAGMAGMCWIAQEVYGIDSQQWKKFRAWLMSKACPSWLCKLYKKHGKQFAEQEVKYNPKLKEHIRIWMDNKINTELYAYVW